ncbi:MAG: DUF2062 domain-containing protein [Campylobacterota bacterium]|nr:DUF2062 domain-containing protein [Campylobacterota bacterium]
MIRKKLKKVSKHDKLIEFAKKYKVSPDYLSANRKMIARAVLIGLFIAFIPMPFQMLAVLAVTPFVRFNVPIALAMCWLSNPITMPFMYYMEYVTGAFVLGMSIENVELTLDWFQNNLDDIFIPMYFGALLYSFFGSILAYYAVNHFWRRSVHKDKDVHYRNR